MMPSVNFSGNWIATFRLIFQVAVGHILSLSATATFAGIKEFEVQSIHPRIEIITFESQSLHKPMSLCVVLPEMNEKQKEDRPVLFWLHGRGRTCRSLVDHPATCEELLKSHVTIIFPQGDDGWYIDSPVIVKDRYESWIKESIQVATERYQLSSNPEHRGICGWSMGGFGAVRFATVYPDQFGTVCSIIGLLDFPREGLPKGQSYKIPTNRFGNNPAVWKNFNPLLHSSELNGKQILVISADQAFDRTMNENFHASLQKHEIPHEWVMLPGAHTFDVVQSAVPLVVNFASRSLIE